MSLIHQAGPTTPYGVSISYGHQPWQKAYVRAPRHATHMSVPVVFLVHGGCWSESMPQAEYMDELARALVAENVCTVNIEYGVGSYSPKMFDEVYTCIMSFMESDAWCPGCIDRSRAFVLGHSVGGLMALALSYTTLSRYIRRFFGVACPMTTEQAVGACWGISGESEFLRFLSEDVDGASAAGAEHGETIIVAAVGDATVPFGDVWEECARRGVLCLSVPGGHMDMVSDSVPFRCLVMYIIESLISSPNVA